jgi:AraC family transcriptional regulator
MALKMKSFTKKLDEVSGRSNGNIVRGHAHRFMSSISLNWKHILVEQYTVEPEEKEETVSDFHLVAMASGNEICRGERPGRRGRMIPYQKEPETINLYENGVQPAIHPFTPTVLTICALDKAFVQEVSLELGTTSGPTQKLGFKDSSMKHLINLLIEEVESGGLSGFSYVDHLTYALATRMLVSGSGEALKPPRAEPLPYHRLQRVVRLMEANLDKDLSLSALAAEASYSRSHFLRMFRTAIGYTPHQYILFLRLEKAKTMMKNSKATLMDIAIACGFSSHAHLTRSFQQALKVTPSYYRRNV